MLGSSPIIWCSRKQQCNVISTTEAEYVALSLGTQEVLWVRQLLTELGMKFNAPTKIHEDNRGCWYLAKTNMVHPRTKHIDIRHHFIRDAITRGEIDVIQCGTKDMLADIFTKPLPPIDFKKHRTSLGLKEVMPRGGVDVGRDLTTKVIVDPLLSSTGSHELPPCAAEGLALCTRGVGRSCDTGSPKDRE